MVGVVRRLRIHRLRHVGDLLVVGLLIGVRVAVGQLLLLLLRVLN